MVRGRPEADGAEVVVGAYVAQTVLASEEQEGQVCPCLTW